MGSRKESAEVLYPFTPSVEAYRDKVKGILDIFFVADTAGSSTSTVNPNYNPYHTVLDSIHTTATENTYTFHIHSPGHKLVRTFRVPVTGGIMRVASQESGLSWMLLNAGRVYAIAGTITNMDALVEPARTVYHLEKVNSIRLVNEYRDYDPRTRLDSISNHPDHTVFYTPDEDSVLSLVDGYNCALDYDEKKGILYINGGPGLGKGLPKEIPWDNPNPLDIFRGIKSINGQNVNSSVTIDFKDSLRPNYEEHSIVVTIVDRD